MGCQSAIDRVSTAQRHHFERVSTEIEEVIVDSNALRSEHLFPHLQHHELQCVSGAFADGRPRIRIGRFQGSEPFAVHFAVWREQ